MRKDSLILLIFCFAQLAASTRIYAQSWEWIQTKDTHEDCTEYGVNLGLNPSGDIFLRSTRICASHSFVQTNYTFRYENDGTLADSANISNGLWRGDVDHQGNLYLSASNIIKKYDLMGQLVWSVSTPNRYFRTLSANSKGVVLGGYTRTTQCTDTSAYLMLDANGNELWNRKADFTPNCGDDIIKIGKDNKVYSVSRELVNGVGIRKFLILDSLGGLVSKFSLPQFNEYHSDFRLDILNNEEIIISASIYTAQPIYTTTIVKYDQQGIVLWTNNIIGNGNVDGIVHDVNDNIFLAGDFKDSIRYQNLKITGNSGLMVFKLNSSGNLLWTKSSAGNIYSNIQLYDVEIDNGSNIYLTGLIAGDHNFDNLSSINALQSNIFLVKLNQNNITTTLSESSIKKAKFNVFPNPSNGTFTIESEDLQEKFTIQIFNNIGQVIFMENRLKSLRTIDISNQPKGFYILRCATSDATFTAKIVLQ